MTLALKVSHSLSISVTQKDYLSLLSLVTLCIPTGTRIKMVYLIEEEGASMLALDGEL